MATPRVPEALALDNQVIDHARIIAELKRSMTHCMPGSLLRDGVLAGVREKSRAMYQDLHEILDRFDPEGADFAGVFDAMADFQRKAGPIYGNAHAIPDGSLSALPRVAMFYGCRSEEPLRTRLFAIFRDEFHKAIDEMAGRTDQLLERLMGLTIELPGTAKPAA